jgi:hypothetical protein
MARPAFEASSAQVQAQELMLPASGPGSIMVRPGGRILVDVRVADTSVATLDRLKAVGARLVFVDDSVRIVTAEVAPSDLISVAAIGPEVLSVREILRPQVNAACPTGDFVSEGDTQLNAAVGRANYSVDGTGVMVGVLSDSYDSTSGAAADVTNGELPGTTNPCGFTNAVTVQADSSTTDEGRAMSQIVHDLAPGADIRFATAFNGEQDFADQIRALAAAGSKVIVDDVSYFDEPMYQDGVIGKAVEDVTAGGVTYFSSAGNNNTIIGGNNVSSYEALSYRPTTCPASVVTFEGAPAGLTCHDFDPGAGTDNTYGITLNGATRYVLGWNEPQFGITTDLDLCLINHSSGALAGCDGAYNISTQDAFELVSGTWYGTYDLVIARYAGTATSRLKLISLGSVLTAVEYSTGSGGDVVGPTIFGHNASRSGATVAAVPYSSANTLEAYSSRGPATYCYGPVDGTTPAAPLASCETATVDMAATDGVANSFFGSGSPHRFYGTSAAAPHAAAVAALLLQQSPCLTPAQVLDAMESTALAVGAFGADSAGAGRLDADSSLGAAPVCPHHLVISPATATITAGASQAYTAEGFDASNNSLGDVTGDTTFTIAGGGSCTGATCTSTVPGDHIVTGTSGDATGTATLHVDAGALHHLVISPADSTITAGASQAYTAEGFDASNNSLGDVTSATTFAISGGGSCNAATCTSTVPGDHTVAGTDGTATGTATLHVVAGTATTLTVSGLPNPYVGGTASTLTVQARDPYGNTDTGYRGTVHFTSSDPLAILPADYTFTAADSGVHTFSVTLRSYGTQSITATDTVTASIKGSQSYISVKWWASSYTAVNPRRVLDTRPTAANGIPTNMGLTGKFVAGTVRTFTVAGARYVGGGTALAVPTSAVAVTGNLTIVGESASGVIALGPTMTATGSVTTLNFVKGDIRANNVTIGLAANGTLQAVYRSSTAGATTELIFDVTGYFIPGTAGATYHSLAPGRVLDTRPTAGVVTHIGPLTKLPNKVVKTFPIAGVKALGWDSALVPTDAVAVTGNLTITNATSVGYVSLGPTMTTKPTTSSANVAKGANVANGVTVALSSGNLQVIWMGTTGSSADVIFDVTGYFTAGSGGLRFYAVNPVRLIDSSVSVGLSGSFTSNTARLFTVADTDDVPADAAGIAGNLTLLAPTTNGWALISPEIVASPKTSTVNANTGINVANGFDVALGAGGHVSLVWSGKIGSTANLSLDITGYWK